MEVSPTPEEQELAVAEQRKVAEAAELDIAGAQHKADRRRETLAAQRAAKEAEETKKQAEIDELALKRKLPKEPQPLPVGEQHAQPTRAHHMHHVSAQARRSTTSGTLRLKTRPM